MRDVIPGLVWGWRFTAHTVVEVERIGDPPAEHEWIWLHFNLADARAKTWLTEKSPLPRFAVERLLDTDDVQQIAPSNDCVTGVFFDLVRDFDHTSDEFGHFRFVLADRLLVTGRRRALSSTEAVRKRVQAGLCFATPAELLNAIVEQIAATIDGIVEELSSEVDLVEDTILKDSVEDDRERLGRARLTSVRIHRRLISLRGLYRRLSIGTQPGPMDALRTAAIGLTERLDEIDNEVVELRDRARLLQEELAVRLAEQTNRQLRILSILTALFLPPTLIAGLFGMNLEGMPFAGSAFGFWLAVGATVFAAGATLLGLRFAGMFR